MPLGPVLGSVLGSALSPALGEGVGGLKPANRNVAWLGDSRTAAGYNGTTIKSASGFISPSGILSAQIFDTSPSWVKATSGHRTDQILARVGDVTALAATVGTVVVLGGTNDLSVLTLQQSKDNMTAIIAAIRAAGQVVVLIAETPRGDLSPGALLTQHLDYHAWLLTQHSPGAGIYVCNPWNDLSDAPDYQIATAAKFNADGIHPLPAGTYWIGKALAATFALLWSVRDIFSLSGNLLVNPTLTGTSGIISNATGQVATSWDVAGRTDLSPATVVASKVSGKQQMVYAGTATTGATPEARLRQDVNVSNFSNGDLVEAFAAVEVDAGSTGMRRALSMEILYNAGASTVLDGTTLDASTYMWPDAWSGVLRTPPFTFVTGETLVRAHVNLRGNQNVAGAATCRVSQVCLRKVA